MKSENDIYEVDLVDKVDIEVIFKSNLLLYIDISMSTLYKYIYFRRWTSGGHGSRKIYSVHFIYFLCPLFYDAN